MFASLALCLAARPAAIDYETKAARLPVILEQLQSQTGLKLTCDGVFESEVMLISVTDVEPGKLLDKIAAASVGEWEKKGNGLYLRPDLKRRATEEKERIARRVTRIQEILDRCKKELETPYTGHAPSARVQGQQPTAASYARERNLPLPRCAMRLLLTIGAERLAQVPMAGRTVFAMTPNAYQAAFPKGAEKAIEQFRDEWEITERIGTRTRWGSLDIGASFRVATEGDVISPRQPFTRVWLSVSDLLNYTSFYPRVYCGMLDDKGYGVGGGLDLFTVEPNVPPQAPKERPDIPLEYDPMTVAFRKARNAQLNRGRVPVDSFGPLAKAIAQDSFEPLSLGTELIAQCAKREKANLVALLPDSVFDYLVGWEKPTVRAIEDATDQVFARDTADGFLILTPKRAPEARRIRDRRKEARLVIKDALDGHLSLDREAAYLITRPLDRPDGLALHMAMLLDGEVTRQYPRGELRAKRIYALLPEKARQSGSVRFREIAPPVRAELTQAVLEDGALSFHTDPTAPFDRAEFDSFNIRIKLDEPTVLWPKGIPEEAIFEMNSLNVLGARLSASKNPNFMFGEGINAAANVRFMQANPTIARDARDPNDSLKQVDRYQPLKSREFVFTLRHEILGRAFWASERWTLSAPVPYDQLPTNYRDAIEKEAERIKASRGTKPPGSGLQRGNPPPP